MHYIGLDIGTTGAKALLADEKGQVLGKGYAGYSLLSNGNCIEQNPDDWIKSGAEAISQALDGFDSADVAAISLSTQGASTIAIDHSGKPIGNAFTWMDTRATKEAAEILKLLGDDYIYKNTGWRVSPALDAAKIMYMKRQSDFQSASMFLSTLEYMNLFFTGNPICDPSNASIRQLIQIETCDYDDQILSVIGASRSELPQVRATGSLVGHLTQQAASLTGLMQGTPVYNGAHDQYCASIGACATSKGDMLLSAGTTWVIMGIDHKPLFTDTYIAPGVHPIAGLYGAIASLVGSGTSLQWFKNNFVSESFKQIDQTVAERTIKTQELFFYPYLSGANYPYWLQNARGAFTGISLDHNRFDFARAIMESVALGVRTALDDFSANGFKIKTLKIMGGAAKSSFWCSLIAAAINIPVEILLDSDSCALGAAMIAAHGNQAYSSLREASVNMAAKTTFQDPDPEQQAYMDNKYRNYNQMWDGISKYYM